MSVSIEPAASASHRNIIQESFCRGRLSSSDVLLIAFSGLGAHPHRPYDFEGLVDAAEYSVLLVRDLSNRWYQDVPEVEGGALGLAQRLATHARGYRRVVCLGFSMGGYAALLFGRLLGADAVLAFAPQTLLTEEGMAVLGDPRWSELIAEARAVSATPRHLDLAETYAGGGVGRAKPSVVLCIPSRGDQLDSRHAHRLAAYGDVLELGASPIGHTAFGVWLRESGALRRLIDAAAKGSPPNLCGVDERYEAWLAGLSHELTVDPPAAWRWRPEGLRVSGTYRNLSPTPLRIESRPRERIRVGARLVGGATARPWPTEWRHDFAGETIPAGQSQPFHLDLNFSDLPEGRSVIMISLVREHCFWFCDLGFPRNEIEVVKSA